MSNFRFSFFANATIETRTEAAEFAKNLRNMTKLSNRVIRSTLLVSFAP